MKVLPLFSITSMELPIPNLCFTLFFFLFLASTNASLFREYIGAENNVKFSDVPINQDVQFHFILSFAIDYDTSSSPSPTNGKFNVFWETDNLTPTQVSSIKSKNSNVKVAMSLGGDSVGGGSAYFDPSSGKGGMGRIFFFNIIVLKKVVF